MAGNTSEKGGTLPYGFPIIVKSHNVDNDIELRIVADDRPHTLAHNITPDLDDLYLYYFKEGDSL